MSLNKPFELKCKKSAVCHPKGETKITFTIHLEFIEKEFDAKRRLLPEAITSYLMKKNSTEKIRPAVVQNGPSPQSVESIFHKIESGWYQLEVYRTGTTGEIESFFKGKVQFNHVKDDNFVIKKRIFLHKVVQDYRVRLLDSHGKSATNVRCGVSIGEISWEKTTDKNGYIHFRWWCEQSGIRAAIEYTLQESGERVVVRNLFLFAPTTPPATKYLFHLRNLGFEDSVSSSLEATTLRFQVNYGLETTGTMDLPTTRKIDSLVIGSVPQDGKQIALAVAPNVLYFLCIDGTEHVDSEDFANQLTHLDARWKNLANFIGIGSKEKRIVDPCCEELPIIRTFSGHNLVEPEGKGRNFLDPIWVKKAGFQAEKKYTSSEREKIRGELRKCAMAATRYVDADILLDPSVFLVPKPEPPIASRQTFTFSPRKKVQLPGKDGETTTVAIPFQRIATASILWLSSHGNVCGDASGDPMVYPWNINEFPRTGTDGFHFFSAEGTGFHSTRDWNVSWVIFALCSALAEPTWRAYLKIFKNSPKLRGVIAYGDVSPNAIGTTAITHRFMRHCQQGQTILKAWELSNPLMEWCAIYHQDAEDDQLLQWDNRKPKRASAPFIGIEQGAHNAPPIRKQLEDIPPPFEIVVYLEGTEVDWRNRHLMTYEGTNELSILIYDLVDGHTQSSSDAAIIKRNVISMEIELVHIRETHAKQMKIDQLFKKVIVQKGSEFKTEGRKVTVKIKDKPKGKDKPENSEPVLHSLSTTRLKELPPDASKQEHDDRTKELRNLHKKGAIRLIFSSPLPSQVSTSHSYIWFKVQVTTNTNEVLNHDCTFRGVYRQSHA
jgi:hypothetical protein